MRLGCQRIGRLVGRSNCTVWHVLRAYGDPKVRPWRRVTKVAAVGRVPAALAGEVRPIERVLGLIGWRD
jgi:hypothetical protein